MFAREEGKLLAIRQLVGKVSFNLQLSSLCRVRTCAGSFGDATTVFTSTLYAGRSSRLVKMQWPSLGKETHGKCLSFGVVAIRFLESELWSRSFHLFSHPTYFSIQGAHLH
jgi:hypothetical protein